MCKTPRYGSNSFRRLAVKLWNELDPNVKYLSSLDDFKKCIQPWTGAPCTCSNCIICDIQGCGMLLCDEYFFNVQKYGHNVIACIHLHSILVHRHFISYHVVYHFIVGQWFIVH